jgi:uncharacterized RDD family membrane protein YckC
MARRCAAAIGRSEDLRVPERKPSGRALAGVILMCCSYIVGWPAVALIGALSIDRGDLAVAALAPVLVVLAHVLFAIGVFLSGGARVGAILRRATRSVVDKARRLESEK